ncbi:3-hydroxyacyl-CoA dehydrogenase family protein [Neoasaia chiangmaiensis]|uniref:3-hydroxyacyl-CoA dehydrogenase family protein n=1 Tax=Neoasaia chiangmaiensis TaxID=320497 RepID=UPI001B800226|nr:3-hydroxyacyl-CoA dehydrogenase family protein [Neoasaia chiangmaiensis]
MAIRTIETVAVVGAGYMGGGIAQSLADAGIRVTLVDASPDATVAAHARLLHEAATYEKQGLFREGAAARIEANLAIAETIEDAVRNVDFIEEAVPEIPDLKRELLTRISTTACTDAIIGTNTSTLPVHTLAPAVSNPARFLTVHFSNPAPFIPGIELVCGEKTDPAILPVVKDMIHRAGHQAAEVADTPGFVLNRLQYVLFKEACAIVEEGIATTEGVDTIVRSTFGFRLPFFGPFAIADMAGLDVYLNCFRTFEQAFGERLAAPDSLRALVEAGKFGTKSGEGFRGQMTPEQAQALVAYRNNAYGQMAKLLHELGPAPLPVPTEEARPQ